MQVLVARKRSFLARGLGLDAYWLPVPRQKFVETAGGMTVGHTLQDVSKPGKGLDVVELCGGDEGADGCPSDAATVRAREQMVLAAEGKADDRRPGAHRDLGAPRPSFDELKPASAAGGSGGRGPPAARRSSAIGEQPEESERSHQSGERG